MSFNIRTETSGDLNEKNWSNRREPVANYILNSGMDVVCLQEVRKVQYEYLATALSEKYEVLYYPRENGSNPEGLAICYEKEFQLIDNQMFWLSETPDKMSLGWGASYYRICANVLLQGAGGVYLNVDNVHLDHQVALARINGLEVVLSRVPLSYPTVVCGDFNTTNESECYKVINDVMWDCQEMALVSDEGVTYQNWGTQMKGKAIDFCFVNSSFTVLEFDILQDTISEGVYYSDHFAIRTKVEVVQ